MRRAAQRIALGDSRVSSPPIVTAVILAKEFGVLPSAILDADFGDVVQWTTILSDLNTTKGGNRGTR